MKSPSKQPSQNMLYNGEEDFYNDMHQQDVIPLQLPKSLMVFTNVTDASDYEVDDIEDLFADSSANRNDADGMQGTVPDGNNTEMDEQATSMGYRKSTNHLPTGVPFLKNSKTMTTIVDKLGIHSHITKYCLCTDALTADIQLCQMELFPAFFSQPKTVFTFEVLDNFLLDNLECGTSAMNYYNKLRRMTTAIFPHLMPVRSFINRRHGVNHSAGPLLGAEEGSQTMAASEAIEIEWLRS
ncbi:uncharacterized protein F5891DRAFT_980513 [Suillus fuscotomentosus]|uniref:CxC2-like cysteine cluster KDZ transposase-associated domain-containing protein n=1 Tax=Suillus fuscotomentosus TaxID=1912939 RepID=A0AAD4E8E8_9AGAM|nr:uncharacterized protein F5891DRAFT_980513 [Suillus fuscotomentosus]KAG1900243.1 hypothetical protein F5891DRAFT_980513 [Suillus fuscotomentosus]